MKHRGLGLLVSMALVGALLVPFGLAVTAGTSGAEAIPQPQCPEDQSGTGFTGSSVEDVCCNDELTTTPTTRGVTQGQDIGVACCPDGTFGHWQWGGTNGQNLYYCDAPPRVFPETAPPATEPAAVSPASAAPKKAASAKPTFTG